MLSIQILNYHSAVQCTTALASSMKTGLGCAPNLAAWVYIHVFTKELALIARTSISATDGTINRSS